VDLGFLWVYSESRYKVNGFTITVYFNNDLYGIEAVLFDPNKVHNVKLNGNIDNVGNIDLNGMDNSGNVVKLEGKFLENDPTGRYGSKKLNCEVFAVNYYTSYDKHNSLIFGNDFGYRGSINNRYSRIGADNDDLVELAVKRFIDGVNKRDKKVVADCMHYPVRVGGDRGDRYINDKEEFIRNFDNFFKPKFSKAISNSRHYHLFVSKYDEAGLGTGLVFFIKNGKVSKILNLDR